MHVVLRIIRTSVRSDLPAAIVQTNQVAKEIKAVMNEETGYYEVWWHKSVWRDEYREKEEVNYC